MHEPAHQRYYNQAGAFWTPDPSLTGTVRTGLRPSFNAVHPNDPTTWNEYIYADHDPINRYDPTGLAPPDCSGLLQKINAIEFGSTDPQNPSKGLIQRFYEQIYGQQSPYDSTQYDLQGNPIPNRWQRHERNIKQMQKGLKDRMKKYIDDDCNPPSNWGVFDYWANKAAPSKQDYKGPQTAPSNNILQWILGTRRKHNLLPDGDRIRRRFSGPAASNRANGGWHCRIYNHLWGNRCRWRRRSGRPR